MRCNATAILCMLMSTVHGLRTEGVRARLLPKAFLNVFEPRDRTEEEGVGEDRFIVWTCRYVLARLLQRRQTGFEESGGTRYGAAVLFVKHIPCETASCDVGTSRPLSSLDCRRRDHLFSGSIKPLARARKGLRKMSLCVSACCSCQRFLALHSQPWPEEDKKKRKASYLVTINRKEGEMQ
ncbi:hypothetical protein BC830DRAFT_690387 [Chytriomyces sp. MP71]|nr:hypothetical protein BC830DRAFT_690387 [Chytriomyces sp. MP71]